jgi:hypothetical protein
MEQLLINENVVQKVRIEFYVCNIDRVKTYNVELYNVEHGSCFPIWIDFDLQIRRDFLQIIQLLVS